MKTLNDIPDPPADFEQDQAALWYRYAHTLQRKGLLYRERLPLLEVYTIGMHLLDRAIELRIGLNDDIQFVYDTTVSVGQALGIESDMQHEEIVC